MSISLLPFITTVLSTPSVAAQTNERAYDDLTRDERIMRLLHHSEGYMWQGDLVEELTVTASTGSRTLSRMEEAGRIVRYRLGRRKVVCLPDQQPEALQGDTPSSHVTS